MGNGYTIDKLHVLYVNFLLTINFIGTHLHHVEIEWNNMTDTYINVVSLIPNKITVNSLIAVENSIKFRFNETALCFTR